MESNSKEMKLLDNQEPDIISNLPDSILCLILSLLPTKTAMSTSILSTKWKNVSPFYYPPVDLNLDDTLFLYENNRKNSSSASFKAFMDKLLSINLRDVPRVNRVVLRCKKKYKEQDFISWVSAIVSRFKVTELYLDLSLGYSTEGDLFQSFNGCVTLTRLELVMTCQLDTPEDFSLPNLKQLYLRHLKLTQCDEPHSINEFIAGCPVLEDLQIISCRIVGIEDEWVFIRCPLLKTLTIENTWSISRRRKPGLVLHAPNLETWMYSDSVATGYLISSFKSLVVAHVDVRRSSVHVEPKEYYDSGEDIEDYDDYGDWKNDVCKIVAACSSAKRMFLSECCVLALHQPTVRLPRFENLTWLALGSVTSERFSVLACLLCNTPKLGLLRILQKVNRSRIGYADFESLVPSPPVCLELHLKTIEYRGFEERKDELKFLNYFLRNGKALQNVVRDSPDVASKKLDDKINSAIRMHLRKKLCRVTAMNN